MTVTAFEGFQHVETHHCVTGSLRHIYAFHQAAISEEMLLGLGEGVGFIYWHQQGQPPFMGGRATPDPSLEELAGQRTGVVVTPHTTSSARKAEAELLTLLRQGTPVMLQVDMGFLPYFDFGVEYHFGGHVVVACGYDPTSHEILIADRDRELHPVSADALAQARGSTYKPFPPRHRWCTFDFMGWHAPTAPDIRTALSNQAGRMLKPPISNMGVSGIRKAAQLVPTWPTRMHDEELKGALFNAYIFISAVGGTGGGAFRAMFSRCLAESAVVAEEPALLPCAEAFQGIAEAWDALGLWFKQASELPSPAGSLAEAAIRLSELADREQGAWSQLHALLS